MSALKMISLTALLLVGLLPAAIAQGPPTKFTAFDFPTATITEAFSINDSEVIVGSYCKDGDAGSTCSAPGFSPSHGYAKKGYTFSKINFPKAFESEATGVNKHGLVVGLFDPKKNLTGDKGHGFHCQLPCSAKGDFDRVDYPGAASTDLQAVNSLGDMVGVWSVNPVPPITDHGFLLSKGKFCTIDVPGGVDTNALGINVKGDIVGSYDDNGTVKAFLLTGAKVSAHASKKHPPSCGGTYTTFAYPLAGVSQTEAAGINCKGVIVGNYLDSAQVSHAFWTSDPTDITKFNTIDPPGAGSTGDSAATAINGSGVVVGNFTDTTVTPNKERAFIAKP